MDRVWRDPDKINIDIEALINDTKEEREDFLNIKATIIHNKTVVKPLIGCNANITPIAVATPLPPLNFNHIGKQWPSTTPSADIETIISNISGGENKYKFFTAIYPLIESKSKTNKANNLLPVRRTFVAPMLPLPIILISP